MTTPSMSGQSGGDQDDAGASPNPSPGEYDGIEFDTFFNNREPGGEKRGSR